MIIDVSGIPINVEKKSIKNMHIYVKPPYGDVYITAPNTVKDSAIVVFARMNILWIKKQISDFNNQLRADIRQYISGESYYLWGKQYFLEFKENRSKNILTFTGNKMILEMKQESTIKQRENFVHQQYRQILKAKLLELLPKWEQKTGLFCNSFIVKNMSTYWGTCNHTTKNICFNTQLAQKPQECLEYIILHELTHIKIKNHDKSFQDFLDKFMPFWREIKKMLNELKLN